MAAHLDAVLLVRQLQVHRICALESPPRTYQHTEGRRSVGIAAHTWWCPEGKQSSCIEMDTKAERIAEHGANLDAVAPKLPLSPTLHGLLTSYSRAVSDVSNELVHLYEIRDALATLLWRGADRSCYQDIMDATVWRDAERVHERIGGGIEVGPGHGVLCLRIPGRM